MAGKNTTCRLIFFALVLSIAGATFGLPSQSQTDLENRELGLRNSDEIAGNRSALSVTFDPPGEGEPDDTRGAGSRNGGRCPLDLEVKDPYVIPLMPGTSSGLTVASRPTLFVYVAETIAKTAKFALYPEGSVNEIYEQDISLTGDPGVIRIDLPETAPALQVGQKYEWDFSLVCDPNDPSADYWLSGSITRTPSNTKIQENKGEFGEPSLALAALYGKSGIWYDTLTTLANLRRSQPENTNYAVAWEQLLDSVGLQAIASKPFIEE